MNRASSSDGWFLSTAAIALTALASCANAPTAEELDAQFAEAERLCLEQKYVEAEALLKAYLTHRPADAGAHYYLGRTFMLADDFRPVMAEGEYQTALRLFRANRRVLSIKRYAPEYFEMMCYLDSVRVIYEQCRIAWTFGVSRETLRPEIERGLDYIKQARAIMPTAKEVDQIGQPLIGLAARLGFSND